MRVYRLNRKVDVSGVSGTGYVAVAVVFNDGTTVIQWSHGLTIYRALQDAVNIHGHDGSTVFEPAGIVEPAYWDETGAA